MDSVLYICVILCIYDICIIMYLCIMYFFQVKFCKRNPGFMDSVRLGAVRAIDECQYQVSSTLHQGDALIYGYISHSDV